MNRSACSEDQCCKMQERFGEENTICFFHSPPPRKPGPPAPGKEAEPPKPRTSKILGNYCGYLPDVGEDAFAVSVEQLLERLAMRCEDSTKRFSRLVVFLDGHGLEGGWSFNSHFDWGGGKHDFDFVNMERLLQLIKGLLDPTTSPGEDKKDPPPPQVLLLHSSCYATDFWQKSGLLKVLNGPGFENFILYTGNCIGDGTPALHAIDRLVYGQIWVNGDYVFDPAKILTNMRTLEDYRRFGFNEPCVSKDGHNCQGQLHLIKKSLYETQLKRSAELAEFGLRPVEMIFRYSMEAHVMGVGYRSKKVKADEEGTKFQEISCVLTISDSQVPLPPPWAIDMN